MRIMAAFSAPKNVTGIQSVAETRVRVTVVDSGLVDAAALQEAGLEGFVQVGPTTWHLVVGFEAESLAAAMSRELMTKAA